jgi:hypothetical protein
MNPITDRIKTGTVGELLVQLRLLEHDVQAAPPIKDSGNDLIAIRGQVFRAIQVKTVTGGRYRKNNLPDFYHILAVVSLQGGEESLFLDESPIFLIPNYRVEDAPTAIEALGEFEISQDLVNMFFSL